MSILEKYHLSIQISIYLKKNSPASMFSNLWSHVERLYLTSKGKQITPQLSRSILPGDVLITFNKNMLSIHEIALHCVTHC